MTSIPDVERAPVQKPARSTSAEFWYQLRTLRSQRWGNLWGYVFVAPTLILYFLFQAWPILRGFYMAFSDYRWIVPSTHGWSSFNGFDNFVEMAQDETFWKSLGIAFKFTIFYIPATIALALFVAVMISKVRNPALAGAYRVISYLPVILPISVSMVVWRSIYHNEFGYLNHFLESVVGVEKPPNWLGSSQWALWAVLIATIWASFGHQALLFLIGIYNISQEIYEAASLDGANALQQVRYITLPLLKPTFALVMVLLLGVLGTTDAMLILTMGGPQKSTHTIGLHLYQIAFQLGDLRLGYAAALSLVVGLTSALIAAGVFRWSRS